MITLALVWFFVQVHGQSGNGDPACPVFIAQDPVTRKSYAYDLKAFRVPDNSAANFVQGKEPHQGWTAYLNVCGSAKVVGCVADTPICQSDEAGNYFSFGTSASWAVGAYYDPTKGPASPKLYDQGVTVTIANGAMCSNGVARSAHLWLKCDPSVTARPATVAVTEADPANPSVSTFCSYYFAPIAHTSFCPGYGVTGNSAQFSVTSSTMLLLDDVTTLTTSVGAFLDAGFTCSKMTSSCNTSSPTFSCAASGVPPVKSQAFNISSVSFSLGDASWSFSSTPNAFSTGDCKNPGPFLTAAGGGSWSVEGGNVYAAYLGETPVLAIENVNVTFCNSCH